MERVRNHFSKPMLRKNAETILIFGQTQEKEVGYEQEGPREEE